MSWLADAHRDYHTVHGWDTCPLDCAESEARAEEAFLAQATPAEIADYFGYTEDAEPDYAEEEGATHEEALVTEAAGLDALAAEEPPF